MNYVEIVNLVFSIIFGILTLLSVFYVIFAVVSVFKKKTYPEAKRQGNYGIIIPARNEAKVIGNLIESIKQAKYPQDKLHIFVIAHNCSDNTAEVARSYGCTVYEYNNKEEATKGYGLRYLFKQIEKDYGIQSFDGYFILDSDNIVSSNYFQKMNDAFMYYDCKNIVASFRNSKNFGKGIIPGLYGIYFAIGCFLESRGRTVCNCSTRVTGTGYVINSESLKDGWNYVTITEDWELTVDQILAGNKVQYCEDAIFYDEQPTSFKIMWRQRVRWKRGHYLVFYYRFKEILSHLFSRKGKFKVTLYDIAYNISPIVITFFILTILQAGLLLLGPLFTNMSLWDIFINYDYSTNFFMNLIFKNYDYNTNWFMNLLFNQNSAYLFSSLRTLLLGYFGMVFMAILCFIMGRKKIRHVNFFLKIALIIIWPAFLAIQFLIDIHALFVRNLAWKTIPHADDTNIEKLKDAGNEL